MKQLKTISLSGKKYAQVAERLRAIHEDYKDFDIVTSYQITDGGGVAFTATITIRDKKRDIEIPGVHQCEVTYTGHSYGKLGGAKAFEKQESIAVGRALAFAGYHADGEIASADEMQDTSRELDTDAVAEAVFQLNEAKTVEELNETYKGLNIEIRQANDVINAGKRRKKEITTIN